MIHHIHMKQFNDARPETMYGSKSKKLSQLKKTKSINA
jgi:hypothetical protein